MSDERPLPAPATQQDMYAHAIVVELRKLNSQLARALQPQQAQGDEVELREPARPKHRDAIPADFPGQRALQAAGITRLADVPRSRDGLIAISGIGEATAEDILGAL